MDDELEDYLADIEDVVNGRIVDMAHAELMESLTEACCDLENELEQFYSTDSRNAVVNKMTLDDLNSLIDSIKALTKTIKGYASNG